MSTVARPEATIAPTGVVTVSAEAIRAQERLAQALALARAGDDRQLAVKVRVLGEQFVRLLTGVLRMTRFHDLKNNAFNDPLRDVARTLATLLDMLGPVHIVLVDGQVYINDLRVRFPAENDAGSESVRLWSRHEVGGLVFGQPITDPQWRRVVALVAADPPMDRSARAALTEGFFAAGITSVELQAVFRLRLAGEAIPESGGTADNVYSRATNALTSLWDQIALGRMVHTANVRRVMSDLVDLDADGLDHTLLLGTTDGQDQDDVEHRSNATPLYVRHSLTVAAISLLLGRTLGLDEDALADLGIAAAFHDLGYATEDAAVKPGLANHGSLSALPLLAERGFQEGRIHRLRVMLGHHRDAVPKEGKTPPSLFARIVRIANDYDVLTRTRPPGGKVVAVRHAPPDALGAMMAAAGSAYDPVLMQLLVNRVGKYPPGTLLELDDKTQVRVVSGVRRPAWFDRPLTHPVRNADGSRAVGGKPIDLATSRRTVTAVRG